VKAHFLSALLILASWMSAPEVRAQALYWLDTNFSAPTLNKADALGNAISSVALTAETLPEGLAVDASGNVYWVEAVVSGARVRRADPSLAGITTLVSGGSSLRGIAVDAADGKLYWTTSNLFIGCNVRKSALDGSGFTSLLAVGSDANLRGIAVHHSGGKIYWADFDRDALYRANLDGSLLELWLQLVTNAHPYGVAIDAGAQQIYWTEYSGKIRRAPLGGGPSATLIGGLANPTYIALDPASGQMYWSEGGAGAQSIYKGPMAGGSRVALALPLTTYGGLAFHGAGVTSAPPASLPLEFALAPLAPNPSRGPVRTEFALPRESHVRLSVIDLMGREVAVLANGTYSAGRHEASWNTDAGRSVPAGIYFVRLVADGRAWMRRVVRTR
jgi:DNA-binding beta-propeller fold protein YncE